MGRRRWFLPSVVLFFYAGFLPAQEASPDRFTFVFWNLKNYAGLAAPAESLPAGTTRKSPGSAELIHQTLVQAAPDLVLLAEMGSREDLAFLQNALKTAGRDLPNAEWVDGPDPDRHVALLSRFPVKSHSVPNLRFDIGGRIERIQRGILDVEIVLGERVLRLVGVHLKSRRVVAESSESEIRRWEADRVRRHLDEILANHPELPILLAGDLNDTKEGVVTRALSGQSDAQKIRWLDLKDNSGTAWTYYSNETDTYERIDFAGVSRNFPWKLEAGSGIRGDGRLQKASDHRPLVLLFKLRGQ